MDQQMWTYFFVVATFGIYIAIAIWSRAGSTDEFYIADHGVHPFVNGMATAADWMSAASFLSMAGLIAFLGYGGSVYLMGWTGGYVLLALLLAPYLREFGKFTVPDFVGDRFYSPFARVVAAICAIFISFTYIAGQMKGVGVAFSGFLGIPYTWGILIGMLIVFFYAVLGGMKGITYTQVAQYCVLIFAYTVPAIFMSMIVTAGEGIGRYIGLGITRSAGYDSDGSFEAIPAVGGYLAYRHVLPGGSRINVGAGGISIDNLDSATAATTKQSLSGFVSYNWDIAPKVSLGVELMHGERETEGGAEGEINRLTFSTKYAF